MKTKVLISSASCFFFAYTKSRFSHIKKADDKKKGYRQKNRKLHARNYYQKYLSALLSTMIMIAMRLLVVFVYMMTIIVI